MAAAERTTFPLRVMSRKPSPPQDFRGRDIAAAVCASLVLAWLMTAVPCALPRATAELPVPPELVWYPVMTAPLLWLHWVRG
jgi:hypothetical protein